MTAQVETGQRYQMLIGDQWQNAASGATFERHSPVDGHIVGIYPNGDAADADRAVRQARATFDAGTWPNSSAKDRAAILRKTADLLRANVEFLGCLIAEEVGKPIRMAQAEVVGAADIFEYYAGLALDLRGEAITQQIPNAIGLIVHEPVGVVGIITPWNFPLTLVSWKLGPALAAGCTAVCKPSHYTPGSTLKLAELLQQAGLPAGVVNVVTSETDNGAVVGQAFAEHPLVDKVAFTGSTATGRKVMQAAAGTLKKVSLELGGKSPNIVFADADNLDAAVQGAFFDIYMNSGQVCQAGSRLLVEESIREPFVEKLVQLTQTGVKNGDPMDPTTTMGPVINESQFDKVLRYIDAGKSEGAQLLTGGGRAQEGDLARGLYVQPTIFDGVDNAMTIAREEIFGPVLSVLSFKDADEALKTANDTLYGLAAAIWTKDINKAFAFAKGVKAGTVWVNAYHGTGLWGMPYGGYKQSGLGRELGHEGLKEFMETKSIQIKLS